MPTHSTEDVFLQQLNLVAHAEHRLAVVYKEFLESVTNSDLRTQIEDHIDETQGHIESMDLVLESYGGDLQVDGSYGIDSVLNEGLSLIDYAETDEARDLTVLVAMMKAEQYECSTYLFLVTTARLLDVKQSTMEALHTNLSEDQSALARVEAYSPVLVSAAL